MNVQVLGCSHHNAPIAIREQLAFNPEQSRSAARALRNEFPKVEAVLLSTCNRVELYVAMEKGEPPNRRKIAGFLGRYHAVDPALVFEHLYEHSGREAVRHLFIVACSLDSMVVGEPQILSQVKRAYDLATQQAGGRAAHPRRLSGRPENRAAGRQRNPGAPAAGEHPQRSGRRFRPTDLRTLRRQTDPADRGGRDGRGDFEIPAGSRRRHITIINRSPEHAAELARRCGGRMLAWPHLPQALAAADLVISTTGAREPIFTREDFLRVEPARGQRPLFILDLAVPRDFDPAIGDRPGVYLYALDDLQQVCQRNRRQRDRELPAAMKIIDQETDRFVGELHHRAVGPVVQRLRRDWEAVKDAEVQRLFRKLPALDDRCAERDRGSFDRLVNKLLHPPLESLRAESHRGFPNWLLDSMTKLFQLKD